MKERKIASWCGPCGSSVFSPPYNQMLTNAQFYRLYKETVNTLRDSFTDLTEEEIIVDPLLILQSIPSCR